MMRLVDVLAEELGKALVKIHGGRARADVSHEPAYVLVRLYPVHEPVSQASLRRAV